MFKKIFLLSVFIIVITSCSADSSSDKNDEGTINQPEVAMVTRIDGTLYDTPPQNGGNFADVTGGIYGNTYFLLKGYKNAGTGKVVIGNKIFNIRLVIPKGDLSVGTHIFNSTLVSGGYYADFNVSGVSPVETVNTNAGSITVTSYNSSTKLLKGNFIFTTNDGVNLTDASHTLMGSFSYVLE
ncbi:MAG: hypothetical protein K2P85_11155 [Flavobacteriaceae bacterium]|nr:hypothetical protein [Flavobacteriaceae bacterium]